MKPLFLRVAVLFLSSVLMFSVNDFKAAAQRVPSIIPEPVELSVGTGYYFLGPNDVILIKSKDALPSANFLNGYLRKHFGFELRIADDSNSSKIRGKRIVLYSSGLDAVRKYPVKEGAYSLVVEGFQIVIKGSDPSGLFYGIQSLIQLLPLRSEYMNFKRSLEKHQDLNAQNDLGNKQNDLGNKQNDLRNNQEDLRNKQNDLRNKQNDLRSNQEDLRVARSEEAVFIPISEVFDYPRFGYRGMHLDVARHIYSVDYIKKFIDYLAYHKLNYFHWHLTDDQGWRIESKKHPRLNEIGSWRDGTIIGIFPGTGVDSTRYGGFYTFEQIKEIVAYAADRYITVVPEIDVPGHSMAILATYPQFSTTPEIPKKVAITWGIYNRQNNVLAPSEEVFAFLSDVFNELMDLFPSKYIHIGADECAKKWWKESASTQEFMKRYGLKDENELQKYFAKRISDIVKARGREFIGWDEMLDDGLVEGAIVMSWRDAKGGIEAVKQGHKAIMTPMLHSYFNIAQKEKEDSLCHRQWLVPLKAVYDFEPVPDSLTVSQAALVLGGQGCMWTEYFSNVSALEYGIFPRLSAMAEVYWSQKSRRNWHFFAQKILDQYKRYDLWGANYSDHFLKTGK